MRGENFDDFVNEVLEDKDVRAGSEENQLRRQLGEAFEKARLERNMSIRDLASAMGSSVSQVQRLLHKEIGGSLTLMTIVRAADALGMRLTVNAERVVVPFMFKAASWQQEGEVEVELTESSEVRATRPRRAAWKPTPVAQPDSPERQAS